jgi:aspartate aminotransferase-like enzyme
MMLNEGLPNIIARHARLAKAARDGVKSLGLPLFADERYASNTVTAVSAPEGLEADKLRKILREQHHVVLSGGQQKLEGKIFRIGHLGWVTDEDIKNVMTALKVALPQAGFKVK